MDQRPWVRRIQIVRSLRLEQSIKRHENANLILLEILIYAQRVDLE